MSRAGGHRSRAAAVLAVFALTAVARADSITLEGSSIPINGCTIQAIRSGRVVFLDARSQRHERSLDEVARLSFDRFEALDIAETRIAEQAYAEGIQALLMAMLEADTDTRRLWTHARLARIHDLRGEFVQAAGHAASVFTLDDDAAWVELEPVSPPNEPAYPAALESLRAIDRARRAVRSTAVRRVLDRLYRSVKPIHDRVAADYQGPVIDAGSTISGIHLSVIRASAVNGARAIAMPVEPTPTPADRPPAPVVDPEPPAAARPPVVEPDRTPGRRSESGPADGPDALDRLLTDGRFEETLDHCARLERNLDGRQVGRYLHQYGRALRGVGRDRDASVMFMRCVVLHPGTAYAERSLIETAVIYRDTFERPGTARRLLERAAADATRHGRADIAAEAHALLGGRGGTGDGS